MNPALLIAWREFRQYVFSRGFLLFLVATPLAFFVTAFAVSVIAKSWPQRTYVVFDQTGLYAGAVESELDLRLRRRTLSEWDEYVGRFVAKDALDARRIPAPFAPAPITQDRIAAFHAAGIEAALTAVAPHRVKDAPDFTAPPQAFRRLDLPADVAGAADLDAASAALRPYLLGEQKLPGEKEPLFAALLIPPGFAADPSAPPAQYWSRNLTDVALSGAISRALDAALQRRQAQTLNLPAGALDDLQTVEAPMTSFRPDRAPGEAELTLKDKIETILPAALTYMLLIVVFSVGQLLLTNMIEERSNKIIEVLLSSVTAQQLMIGKLVGIGAVGLVIPVGFAAFGAIAGLVASGPAGEAARETIAALFSGPLLATYLFYFLSAYVIFASTFLAVGAMSNSLQDAQTFLGPVMLIVFLPMPFIAFIYQNPNSLMASVLTFIPVYTPYAVMLRAAANPPLWEILSATILMLIFMAALLRFTSRLFRNALLQSAPPKVREIWALANKDAL